MGKLTNVVNPVKIYKKESQFLNIHIAAAVVKQT